MRHRLRSKRPRIFGSVCVAGAVAIYGGVASASPLLASVGLPIAATGRCQVGLSKVSYDAPGSDDAEFVELRVVVTPAETGSLVPPHAGKVPCDAHDASAELGDAGRLVDAAGPNAPLTLADCGLETLELVDGGSNACNAYRTFELGRTVVPDDGYVVICATDSALATSNGCDVNHAGHSALRNGWIQNGPNDGMRFSNAEGEGLAQVSYEGGPACFEADTPLVPETGDAVGIVPATDDVNVYCNGRFVLLPATEAALRTEARCPQPPDAGSSITIPLRGEHRSAPPDAGEGEYAPERAPDIPGGGGVRASTPYDFDAGPLVIPKRESAAPPRPGCAVSRRSAVDDAARTAHGTLLGATFVAALALFRRRRRCSASPVRQGAFRNLRRRHHSRRGPAISRPASGASPPKAAGGAVA